MDDPPFAPFPPEDDPDGYTVSNWALALIVVCLVAGLAVFAVEALT